MAANYEDATPSPTVVDDGGRFVRGWLVTFRTKPSGLAGEIRVAGDTPDPAEVDAKASALAAVLEQIKAS